MIIFHYSRSCWLIFLCAVLCYLMAHYIMKQSLFESFRDRRNPYFRYDCNHVSNKVVIVSGFYLHLLTNKQIFEDYYLNKSPIINKIDFVELALNSISDYDHRVFWIQIPLSVKKVSFHLNFIRIYQITSKEGISKLFCDPLILCCGSSQKEPHIKEWLRNSESCNHRCNKENSIHKYLDCLSHLWVTTKYLMIKMTLQVGL